MLYMYVCVCVCACVCVCVCVCVCKREPFLSSLSVLVRHYDFISLFLVSSCYRYNVLAKFNLSGS
jgi:hypothetical protein